MGTWISLSPHSETSVNASEDGARRGLRGIAAFEALKGLLVILVGFGLLALVHRDLQDVGEKIIFHFHLNPARTSPRIFLKMLSEIGNMNLRLLAAGALAYSILRFVEAYGLWFERVWAEWLAILSSGIYLPWELYDLWKGVTWIRLGITTLNVVILFYLIWIRVRQVRKLPRSLNAT